ncbi:MAG: Fe(3+) ABC transporter substrate-binding protein [Planctomycetota bacterium]
MFHAAPILAPILASLVSLTPAVPSQPETEIIVYSARHYDSDKLIYDAFEKESGIRVKLAEDKGNAILARLKDRNAPGDVFVTVDAGNLWAADEAGLFQSVDSEVLEKRIPAHLRQAEGRWFGLSMRARCIFYDREKVKPEELSTYEALADPKWKGRVLIRSSSNVYNQSLVGSLIAHHGEEKAESWARGLVANMARKPQGGDTDQIRAVAAGEGDVAVGNSYYYARLLKSDSPEDKDVVSKVGIFFPNQEDRGTHVNISGAGVLKVSKNREAAQRFIEFLASDEAQAIFAGGNNEFPVVATVEADPVLKPWLENRFDKTISVEDFGRRTGEALRLMDRVGWR